MKGQRPSTLLAASRATGKPDPIRLTCVVFYSYRRKLFMRKTHSSRSPTRPHTTTKRAPTNARPHVLYQLWGRRGAARAAGGGGGTDGSGKRACVIDQARMYEGRGPESPELPGHARTQKRGKFVRRCRLPAPGSTHAETRVDRRLSPPPHVAECRGHSGCRWSHAHEAIA